MTDKSKGKPGRVSRARPKTPINKRVRAASNSFTLDELDAFLRISRAVQTAPGFGRLAVDKCWLDMVGKVLRMRERILRADQETNDD